ncbi:MAG: hypothetical protein WCS85_05965 [Candidatus Peribacteraceae bacterium]|jgi:hypothetical protein
MRSAIKTVAIAWAMLAAVIPQWVMAEEAATKGLTISMGFKFPPSLPKIFGNLVVALVGIATPLMITIFLYGAFLTVMMAHSEEQAKKGKTIMINAIFGLAVVAGSYGMIRMLFFVIYG